MGHCFNRICFFVSFLVALPSVASTPIVEVGARTEGAANLVAIQPELEASDFVNVDSVIQKLRTYFEAAKSAGLLSNRTVVVLPEYLGTWLMAAGEDPKFYQKKSLQSAMLATLWSERKAYWRAFRDSHSKDRLTEMGFRVKSAEMAKGYQKIGSTLARGYGVTLVLGSINLPGARVGRGVIAIRPELPLENVSGVFRPDGTLETQLVRKTFPTAPELKFLKAAPVESLPVFNTPAGRIGVLICADAWHPETYIELAKKGVDAVVVPQVTEHGEIWNKPWGGYSPQPDAKDVDPRDHDGIAPDLTEAQAWDKYALPGRLASSGARAGVMASAAGRAWDMNFGGQSVGVQVIQGIAGPVPIAEKAPQSGKAAIVSVWY